MHGAAMTWTLPLQPAHPRPWPVEDDPALAGALPTVAQIEQAAAWLAPWHTPSPVMEQVYAGRGIALKCEQRLPTGAFKVRGAWTALRAARDVGHSEIVACSAGNHGAGLVWAAERLGLKVRIFVPEACPPIKRRKMEKGAELVVVAGGYDQAEAAAREEAVRSGVPFVSPFADPWVMAGNGGTLARELAAQCAGALTVLVPVGGGGLLSGLMVWALAHSLPWRVIGVQSEASPAFAASLRDGRWYATWDSAPTVAEGLEGGAGETSVLLARRAGIPVVTVPESQIVLAMRHAEKQWGEVIEGSAAVVLAAIPALEELESHGRLVGVLTGGNREVLGPHARSVSQDLAEG